MKGAGALNLPPGCRRGVAALAGDATKGATARIMLRDARAVAPAWPPPEHCRLTGRESHARSPPIWHTSFAAHRGTKGRLGLPGPLLGRVWISLPVTEWPINVLPAKEGLFHS